MRTVLFSFLFLLSLAPTSAQQANDSLLFYYNAIVKPAQPEDLPVGLEFYNTRKEVQLQQNDTLGAIESLRLLAIGQFKMGELYDSESAAVEALALISQYHRADTLTRARVGLYNQLGRTYSGLLDYPAARTVLEQGLQLADTPTDSIILLNNLANTYNQQKQFPRALELYSLIYKKALAAGNTRQQAFALDNLGDVLTQLREPAALDTLLSALQLRTQSSDLSGLYSSYKNLATYYHQQNDTPQALAYAEKASDIAEQLNSQAFRYDALELFMRLHPDPKVLEYNQLTDSLDQAERLAQNKNAYIKYNLSEERAKTARQALEKERQTRSKQLFQLSTVFILILLVLSYFVFRYRYKKGRQEEMYKTESRISKKVHDELANDVFNVLAFAESKTLETPADKEKLLHSLDQIYSRTRDISKDTALVPTGPEFPQALKELLSGFSSQHVNVIINGLDNIPWAKTSDLKKMACYRVLQELMVNMRKHSGASLVLLKFNMGEGRAVISYSDNGSGLPKTASLNRGGLRIAENRIEAIKGRFTFESSANQGFRCSFSFPL